MTDAVQGAEVGGQAAGGQQQRPRWVRPAVLCGALLVVAGGAVAVVLATSGPSDPGSFTLRGSFVLNRAATTAVFELGGDCTGYRAGGTGDLVPGAAVTVYDAEGTPVAHGRLGKGRLPEGSELSTPCSFPVVVRGVPRGSASYQVEVAGRGKVPVSAKDAEAGRFGASVS